MNLRLTSTDTFKKMEPTTYTKLIEGVNCKQLANLLFEPSPLLFHQGQMLDRIRLSSFKNIKKNMRRQNCEIAQRCNKECYNFVRKA